MLALLHSFGTVRTLKARPCSSPGVVQLPFAAPHIVRGRAPAYRTCAVVGSGGALLGHEYGPEISSADAVFRANHPPTAGFERHVGNRTDVHAMNTLWYPRMAIDASRGEDCTGPSRSEGGRDPPSQGGLLMERETCMGGRLSVSEVDNGRYSFVGHFNNVVDIGWRWWAKTHPGTHFTTGMAMVAMALSMCDTVRLYGFSDEPSDHYHYYDSTPSGHKHDFTSEHALYDSMQEKGVAIMCGYPNPLDYMASAVQDASWWWYAEHLWQSLWAR